MKSKSIRAFFTGPCLASVCAASLCGWALIGGAAGARAQAPLVGDLGGPGGFGTGVLEYNDDGSSAEIDITHAFPNGLEFFGQRFRSIYVNNNGNITFGGATGTFTPSRFPISGQRMIAPWWGDVDTRGGGRPQQNGVYWDIRPGQLVVTWHNVGFYSSDNSRQNSFQLVIRGGEGWDEDRVWQVEFRYNRCEWTTGNASGGSGGLGGTPAQAGFDAGNGRSYEILPGSGSQAILNLCRTSNVEEPGVWQYVVEMGAPRVEPTGPARVETTDFSRGGGATAPPR